ncbi:hypothetical protein ABFW11_00520 [Mycolicibacterium porcinum]|uniref:hypothetical protein n=1 Tax=Mycolicibacterium porcinum TaxID=39693 RepID=UPI0034CD9866
MAAKREARAANSTRYRAQQLRQADDAQQFITVTRDLALTDRAVALEQRIERLGKQAGSHRAERALLTAELAHVQGAISAQKRAQFLREIGVDPMLTDHDVTRAVYQRVGLPQPSEAALVAAYGARTDALAPPTNAKGHAVDPKGRDVVPELRISPVSGNIGALPGEPKELLRMHKRRDLIASTPAHNPETLRRLDARIAAAEAKSKVHQAPRSQSAVPAPTPANVDTAPAPVDTAPAPTEPRVHVPLTPPLTPPTTVPVTVPTTVPVSANVPPVSANVSPMSTPPAASAPTSIATTGEGHATDQRESRASMPSPEVVDANRQRVGALVESLKARGQDDETTRAQIAAVRDAEPTDSPLRVALTEAWEELTPRNSTPRDTTPNLRESRTRPQFITPSGGGSPFDALMARMGEQEREEALARVRAQRDADEHTSSSFARALAEMDG